jgi:hypothetical protein
MTMADRDVTATMGHENFRVSTGAGPRGEGG